MNGLSIYDVPRSLSKAFIFLLMDAKYTVLKLAAYSASTEVFRAPVTNCMWEKAAFLADNWAENTWNLIS